MVECGVEDGPEARVAIADEENMRALSCGCLLFYPAGTHDTTRFFPCE